MATATIPEVIVPGTLFTPDDTDIAISAAAMPNGDNLLSITNSGVVRAYQAATDGVHYQATIANPMSISFWIDPDAGRTTSPTTSTSLNPTEILMGVMDPDMPYGSPQATSTPTTGLAWMIGFVNAPGNASDQAITYHRSIAGNSRRYYSIGLSTALQMVTIIDPGHGNGAPYGYTNVTPSGLGAEGTGGTHPTLADPHFCIGPYSAASGWDSMSGTQLLGKIAIFDRVLTVTEIYDLYQSAIYGPAS